ncbi:MAG: MerR family transcriptional regulator [Thermoanaerobaculia bacterium]
MDEWLSISQVTRIMGLTADTIRAWEAQGRLKAGRTEGGHRRFRREEVYRLAETLGRRTEVRNQQGRAPAREESFITDLVDEPDSSRQELREARDRVEILRAKGQASQILEAQKAEAEHKAARAALQQRHEELKAFGRSVASGSGLPPEWRARVTQELETYINGERFPISLLADEAREYIRTKVLSIVEEHREVGKRREAEGWERLNQEIAQRRQDEELAARRTRVKELVDEGVHRAALKTIWWDPADRDDTRQDVLQTLRDEVRHDWTSDQVRRLVDEVLDECDEPDEEDEEESDALADDEDGAE